MTIRRPSRRRKAEGVARCMLRGLGAVAAAGVVLCLQTPGSEPSVPHPSTAAAQAPAPLPVMAPTGFANQLALIVAGFDGKVGVAVHDVQEGWTASVDGLSLYPQQSVSKLWVALAVFDAVDRGTLALNSPVMVRRDDMSVFHQPIQEMLTPGGYETNIDRLLVGAIAQSDNAANDILVAHAGGSAVVQRTIGAKGLGAIHSGPEEKVLQSNIAGVRWRPEYSFGRAFWTARDRVPAGLRSERLMAYLRAPEDGATPVAIAQGLGRLARGELLSPASTIRFIQIMASTETGPDRLKAGLAPGWRIAHKTGTGQVMGALSTGYNDVGLITAPDGHDYAVAVMIASTSRPIPERQAMMSSVSRTIVALHDGYGPVGP